MPTSLRPVRSIYWNNEKGLREMCARVNNTEILYL